MASHVGSGALPAQVTPPAMSRRIPWIPLTAVALVAAVDGRIFRELRIDHDLAQKALADRTGDGDPERPGFG